MSLPCLSSANKFCSCVGLHSFLSNRWEIINFFGYQTCIRDFYCGATPGPKGLKKLNKSKTNIWIWNLRFWCWNTIRCYNCWTFQIHNVIFLHFILYFQFLILASELFFSFRWCFSGSGMGARCNMGVEWWLTAWQRRLSVSFHLMSPLGNVGHMATHTTVSVSITILVPLWRQHCAVMVCLILRLIILKGSLTQ